MARENIAQAVNMEPANPEYRNALGPTGEQRARLPAEYGAFLAGGEARAGRAAACATSVPA